MLKLVVVSWAIICPQLSSGRRVNINSQTSKLSGEEELEANATTKYDILMCDSMCMQCPDGRNIMIQRQKGTWRNALALGLGAVTYGIAIPVVNQLAGCDKIGFEFWHNRKLEKDQPLRTESMWRSFFPTSGLQKLQKQADEDVKTSGEDLDALEYCQRLTDPFLWQAVRGSSSWQTLWGTEPTGSAYEQQQEFARRCLSHSALCGTETEWSDEDLNVLRLNPFTTVEMCSPPKDISDPDFEEPAGNLVDGEKHTGDMDTADSQQAVDGTDSDENEGDAQENTGSGSVEDGDSSGTGSGGDADTTNVEDGHNGFSGSGSGIDAEIEDEDTGSSGSSSNADTANLEDGDNGFSGSGSGIDAEVEDETGSVDPDTGNGSGSGSGGNDDTANVEDSGTGETSGHGSGAVGPDVGIDALVEGTDQVEEDLTVPDVEAILTDSQVSANTVEEAEQLLVEEVQAAISNGAATGVDDKFFGLNNYDEQMINNVAYKLCRTDEHYEKNCKSHGFDPTTCKDRCCLDVCRFFSVRPSCVRKCVRDKKERMNKKIKRI